MEVLRRIWLTFLASVIVCGVLAVHWIFLSGGCYGATYIGPADTANCLYESSATMGNATTVYFNGTINHYFPEHHFFIETSDTAGTWKGYVLPWSGDPTTYRIHGTLDDFDASSATTMQIVVENAPFYGFKFIHQGDATNSTLAPYVIHHLFCKD